MDLTSNLLCLISALPDSTDATKITLAPSNADINQGDNVTLQCHASHDPTMDLTFTWALNGVLLDLEDTAGPFHRVEGVSAASMVFGNGPPGLHSSLVMSLPLP